MTQNKMIAAHHKHSNNNRLLESRLRRFLSITQVQLMISLILLIAINWPLIAECQQDFYERPGVLSVEILRARGYLAEEEYFTTPDNYVIRLTRARNPLIRAGAPGGLAHRAPILFVHGILEADNVFVINSFNARPRDLSNLSLTIEGKAEVAQLMNNIASNEPSARSLPLLALNFGHEIWLMSRRGFPGSQELVGDPVSIKTKASSSRQASQSGFLSGFLGGGGAGSYLGPLTSAVSGLMNLGATLQQVPFSFDRKFWNFSFDEQARYDLPQAIDYVCKATGREKIHLVTHSAGGAIELMALSQYPNLSDRILSSILWSQGFSLGHDDAFVNLAPLLPLLERYVGSVPPAFATGQIQSIAGLFCATPFAQRTLCEGVADLLLGASNGQQPISPQFINSLLYPTASHELAQNLQMLPTGHMRAYNYGAPYNASAIRLKTMSFYVGATDRTVSAADVRATLPLLKVPYRFHVIDTAFNHNAYFYHQDNARLAIIPSLREIHQFEAAAASMSRTS